MVKKRLWGGNVIEVDPQVIRWQKRMKKRGLHIPTRKPKLTSAERELAAILKLRK